MSIAIGLFILRLVVGLSFMAHGAQKLFGWFGGYGPKGTGGWMESLGLKPGVLMAVLAGLGEFVGGLLFAAGFLTPLGAALIAVTMIMAIVTVHGKNGYWSTERVRVPTAYYRRCRRCRFGRSGSVFFGRSGFLSDIIAGPERLYKNC